MPKRARWILTTAAVSLLLATALGAYASHGLEARMGTADLDTVELAIQYQFFASLGLVGLALLAERYPRAATPALAALALGAGIVLFCGSIYATAFGASEALSGLTPVGGVALMAGWALLGVAAWRMGRNR